MFQRSLLLSLALLGVSNAAHASFDLMFLPQSLDSRVVRFDPINKIVLGTLGYDGGLQTNSTNLMQNGMIAFTSTGGTTAFNSSTGERGNAVNYINGLTSMSPSRNKLFEAYFGSVFSYNGSSLNFISQIGSPITNLVVANAASDSLAFAYGTNAAGDFSFSSMNFTLFTTTPSVSLIASSAFGGIATIGTGFATSNGIGEYFSYIPFRNNFGVDYIMRNRVSSNGIISETVFVQVNNFGAAPKAVLPGHNGIWVVGDDSANSSITRITEISSSFAGVGTYTTSLVNTPSTRFKADNIVAPEPASMIAIGVGLAAMLKRRRSA